MVTDKRAGITTMAMKLGPASAAKLYAFEMVFPFVWVGICSIAGILPLHTIIIFMTIPIALGCAKTLLNGYDDGPEMTADLDVRTANLQLLFSLLLSVAFVAARFI
jgi:1,4-dihydroxy-2-naphthoate octaprenyltransferase